MKGTTSESVVIKEEGKLLYFESAVIKEEAKLLYFEKKN
jgi:hypothetical protein